MKVDTTKADAKVRSSNAGRKLFRARKPSVYFGAAVGLALVGWLIYYFAAAPSLIDKSIIKDISFPAYVPTRAPSGYKIEPGSVKSSGETLTYTFQSNEDDRGIVVTVQPLPKDFNMKQLIGSGSVTTTNTDNGVLYDLSASQKTQYLLNTGDALVFFTSSSPIDTSTINSLASDLVKQN